MKHLSKIVTAAAVAALSLSCVSAFAMGERSNAGQETAQTNVEEKKADRSKPECKGGKDKAEKPELTEEEKAARAEKAKARLAEKLAEGKITQEEYDEKLAKIEAGDFKPDFKGGRDKADKPELTEEEKAARAEKAKAKLAEKLAEGKITQEEYDEALAKIESGDFKPDHRGGKGHSNHKPHDKAADETKENESTVE